MGLSEDRTERIQCRRAHLTCNGVHTCEFFDEKLFQNCERFEPDEEAMRELWNHELVANQKEVRLSKYDYIIFFSIS